MTKLAKILIAGSALLTLSTLQASAGGSNSGGSSGTQVLNGQVNLTSITSQTNADAYHVQGDVQGTSSAVGNTAEIFTMNNTSVANDQVNTGNVMSETNSKISGAGGDVTLTASSVCNAVDVSTDPQVSKVNTTQICGSLDPSATVNAGVHNVGGVVTLVAQAVGNQFTSDSNANHFPVQNYQEQTSNINATVNTSVSNVGGLIAQSSAVGNTAQIIHYSTN